MKINHSLRYNTDPNDAKRYDTTQIRNAYLLDRLMVNDEVNLYYTFYDRMIVGGIVPATESYVLEPMAIEKADFFLQRREMGIINVGNSGKVIADGEEYNLDFKDSLYLGLGVKKIEFKSTDSTKPAHFYINSCLAHKEFPSKLVKQSEGKFNPMGTKENANERSLNQYIVPWIVPTCQLMMGITEVRPGSVWNTMPCHLHPLRMEAYFYFEIPENQAVCHFMGQPQETRHIWLQNEQAVLSPEWSLHTAAGTANYSFIWGMAGSDSPVDPIATKDLR